MIGLPHTFTELIENSTFLPLPPKKKNCTKIFNRVKSFHTQFHDQYKHNPAEGGITKQNPSLKFALADKTIKTAI